MVDDRFASEVVEPIKSRMCIQVQVGDANLDRPSKEQRITFSYTRNDAGGLQDAIDSVTNYFALRGVKTEFIQGRLSRPKSDSFEDFAPYFSSAILQKSPSNGSHDLNRPGSRLSLSGEPGYITGEKLQAEPGRVMGEVEVAFYNGDRGRRGSGQDSVTGPPGSAGSASSRGSFHSRTGSLESEWEKVSQHSRS